jgi:hypothetical protein
MEFSFSLVAEYDSAVLRSAGCKLASLKLSHFGEE